MEGSDVKEARRKLALTQAELAAEIGVHPVTVAKWEADMIVVPKPIERLLQLLVLHHRKRRPRQSIP
jgi:DNA-binding transcriptional regulator YiaG